MNTLTEAFSTATELHCLLNRATLEAQAFAEWERSLELAELVTQIEVLATAIHQQQFKARALKLENN
jgi:hypothetical protein